MITAGIDVGFEAVKIVILRDGKIIGRGRGPSGAVRRLEHVEEVYRTALAEAGVTREEVVRVFATGKGKYDVPFADDRYTEVAAAAEAMHRLHPEVTQFLSLGADECFTVVMREDGSVREFAINEKCAAGIGSLLRYFARRLELTQEEMSALEPYSGERISDGCVVFAELDALSMLNRGAEPKEVAAALTSAMAVRAATVYHEPTVPDHGCLALIGGLAGNKALVNALEAFLSVSFRIPEDAEYIGAIGAALKAAG